MPLDCRLLSFPPPPSTHASAGPLPTLCLPEADSMAGEARSSPLCLLGQGQTSRPGQEAGASPAPGRIGASFQEDSLASCPAGGTGFRGLAPCSACWRGPGGWRALILSVFPGVYFFSSLGKSICYLCISCPSTKLIKPLGLRFFFFSFPN